MSVLGFCPVSRGLGNDLGNAFVPAFLDPAVTLRRSCAWLRLGFAAWFRRFGAGLVVTSTLGV
ncbi:MAG: hypothetical protein AAF442_02480 [Pseudomonadota bacterium]